jgi:antitoxin MazE
MSGIAQDDVVDITVENGVILIKKTSRRKSIQELFDGYTGEYSPEEPDWGAPAGNEIW